MRHVLAAAAAIASLSAAQANDASCPASIDVEGEVTSSHTFRYVSFFDGDPAEMAGLAPEEAGTRPMFEQRWQFSRAPGRPIVMVCRYHDTQETVRKEVPADVQECRLEGMLDSDSEIVGSPTLSCR